MGLVLDLILVAFVVLMVFIGVKRGFVRTVIQFVGYFLILTIALTVGNLLSGAIYNGFVRPSLVSAIEKQVTGIAEENVDASIETVLDEMPEIVRKSAESFGVNFNNVGNDVKSSISSGSTQIAELIVDSVAKKIIVNLISIVLICVIFLILIIPMKLVAKSISKIFRLPVIGTLNSILGGALGFMQSMIFIVLAVIIIKLLVQITGGGFGIITENNIKNSLIFGLFYGLA